MLKSLRKRCFRRTLALSLAVLLAASPLATVTSYASSATAQGTRTGSNNSSSSTTSSSSSSGNTGTTTGWANVRTGPGTSYAINTTYAPGTHVTIYESVSGEAGWSGPTWYRISANPSLYIYGGLVSVSSGSSNSPSSSSGKEIVVSLSGQWLTAYQNGN